MGADLAFVFCATEACVPIKSYSPELMVTSFYNGVETAERDDMQYPDPVSRRMGVSASSSESTSVSVSVGEAGAGAESDRKADPQRAIDDVSSDALEKKVRKIVTCAGVKVASYGLTIKDDLNYLINFRAVSSTILSTLLSPSLQSFHPVLYLLLYSPLLSSLISVTLASSQNPTHHRYRHLHLYFHLS